MSLRLDRFFPSPAQGTGQRSTVPPASEPVAPGGPVSVRLWFGDGRLTVAGDPRALAPAVAAALRAYRWPGNVREARDAIGLARSMAESGEIMLDDLPRAVCHPGDEPDPDELHLQQSQREVFERSAILLALMATGNVSRAAHFLEIPRSAMLHAMRRYGLEARTLGVTE